MKGHRLYQLTLDENYNQDEYNNVRKTTTTTRLTPRMNYPFHPLNLAAE
jgi:hypothetical protein